MSEKLPKRLLAEVIGTFGFFFIGFCGIASITTQPDGAIEAIGVSLGFGLGLGLMIFAFGHISGGHFNPAVTLGLTAAKRFPAAEILPYWGAQVTGGLLASLLIRVLFTSKVSHALINAPGGGVNQPRALVLEIVFTMLFVLVIATVATDDRAPWKGVLAPLAIGLFIFTAASVAGPLSGGSFNPARSLTPAIIAGVSHDLWLYIVGPLIGGVLGGVINAYFRDPTPAA